MITTKLFNYFDFIEHFNTWLSHNLKHLLNQCYLSWSDVWSTDSAVCDTDTRMIGPLTRNVMTQSPAWIDWITSSLVWTKETRACMTPNNVTRRSSLPYLQDIQIAFNKYCKTILLQILTNVCVCVLCITTPLIRSP